jgi:hypothetical protein
MMASPEERLGGGVAVGVGLGVGVGGTIVQVGIGVSVGVSVGVGSGGSESLQARTKAEKRPAGMSERKRRRYIGGESFEQRACAIYGNEFSVSLHNVFCNWLS